MKKICVTLTLVSLIFTACDEEISGNSSVRGTWELDAKVEGMTGKVNQQSAGNGNILKFTETNFEKYQNGELSEKGTFKIIKDTSILTKKLGDRIIFNDIIDNIKEFINIREDKMVIYIDAYDSPSDIYKKQNK